jgi:hypothetical protein
MKIPGPAGCKMPSKTLSHAAAAGITAALFSTARGVPSTGTGRAARGFGPIIGQGRLMGKSCT